jgi:hypothetical protein
MNASRTTGSAADVAELIGTVNTGAGVLTVMVFPFALPLILLTVAFAAPLVILAALVALPVAVVAGVVAAIRRLIGRPG